LVDGESATGSFSYTAKDDGGAESAFQTVNFSITGTNDAPVLTAGSITGQDEDALEAGISVDAATSDLLSGASDVDDLDSSLTVGSVKGTDGVAHAAGSAVTVTLSYTDADGNAQTQDVSLTVNADGSYSIAAFDLDALVDGESATGSFSYTAKDDGGAESAFQTVNFSITGTNDAPTAVPDTIITNVAAATNFVVPERALLANDVDPDGGITLDVYGVAGATGLTATHTPGTGTGGFVTVNDFNPAGGSFTYQATDGLDAGSSGTVTVTRQTSATFNGTAANEIFIGSDGNNEIYNFDLTSAGGFGHDAIRDAGGNNEAIRIVTSAPTNSTSITSLNFERVGNDLVIEINDSSITVYDQYVSATSLSTLTFTNGGTVYGYALNDTGYALNLNTTSPLDGSNGTQDIIAGTSSVTGETLNGLNKNDLLFGNLGNDTLNGGNGNDLLVGGDGNDVFVFDTSLDPANNVDVIGDFKADGTDKILLDDDIFTALGTVVANTTLSAANFAANSGATAGDSNDYILYDTATGNLYYDADGSGAGAKVLFATLTVTAGTVDNTDFVVGP
jgi:VCBS repeat-containing protein